MNRDRFSQIGLGVDSPVPWAEGKKISTKT
jgi:hypothetical protein